MNLTRQQVQAVVDTLEMNFNKEKEEKEKLVKKIAKPDPFKEQAEKIAKEFNKLSLETRKFIDEGSIPITGKSCQIAERDIKEISETLKEDFEYEEERKNRGKKVKVEDVFDREEVTRQVVMKALSVKNITDLATKLKITLP